MFDVRPALKLDLELVFFSSETKTFSLEKVLTAPEVTAPTAKNLNYTGSAQELVNAGYTDDGTLYYAVTEDGDDEPADGLYTTAIPTGTEVGTYFVWYKVAGDDDHDDSEPDCIEAAIEEEWVEFEEDDAEEDEEYSIELKPKGESEKGVEWKVTKGSLPEGLEINSSTGEISGTPKKAGNYTFTVKEQNTGTEKKFTLNVKKAKHDKDDDDDDDHYTRTPTVFNPDEITVIYKVNGVAVANMKAGKQAQGPVGAMVFKQSTPAGWQEAFSFNIAIDGKTDYTLKNGVMTLYVPAQYIKANRQYAILALGKNGQVQALQDTDILSNAVTVNLNLEGYAFELIYKD